MTLERDFLLHKRYRIAQILGQGGMGSVYRAVDENLGVDVAVKENLFATDEYARQFRLEAVILANLRHPNLPRVYDHFSAGDQGQYLVMDYIEGEDLRQRMERLGTISEDDAVQIGAAICDALSYLHTRKPSILHRDIKPGNVKITPDGHIYLVDFGLAKVVQGTQATTTGARAMTPGYSPPEQYGTARTDPRTDIYSLGATLYASLSGVIPEDGLARAMDNAQLTPLRKRAPKVSRRLAAAIEKAMAIDPSDRFQEAEEFKKALLGAKSKTQQLAGTYVVAPPPPESLKEEDPSEMDTDREPRQKSPAPVVPLIVKEEEQPFVSPQKKQKERERKRQGALLRFLFVFLVLVALGVYILAPVLPAEIRSLLPFISPSATPTATVTFTPPPAPTETVTLIWTETATPSSLPPSLTPTQLSMIVSTETLLENATETPSPTATITPTMGPTQMGGGSGQIAFASVKSGGLPQIYLMDVAGSEPVKLTDMPNGACQPAWSPDGMKLVFVSPCKGMEDQHYDASMYTINADGSGLQQLSTVPGGDFDPDWSPDGTKIAFTSLRSGKMEIYVLTLADQSVVALTNRDVGETSRQPAWSPDGAQIAYVVQRFGVNQIWLMTADGENERQLIRSGTALTDYLPSWSVDGKTILYSQHRVDAGFAFAYLMSVPADSSAKQGTRLLEKILPIEDAHFSPDGFWIIYEGNNSDIFYVTVNGESRTMIETGKGPAFDPAWRPIVP